MGDRRVATRPLDPAAAAAADAALAPETGGRPIGLNEDELQEKWMDAYVAAGGEVEALELEGRDPHDSCVKCQAKRLVLHLESVEFLSDHDLIKNQEAEWTSTGTRFTPPDWTVGSSNPITHSMSEAIKLKTIVVAEPDGVAESGRLMGKIGSESIFVSGVTAFSPGEKRELTLQSTRRVIAKVRKQEVPIDWQVRTTGRSYPDLASIGTSHNEWYTTVATPRDPGDPRYDVTLRRMRKAVELVSPLNSTDPHTIVHGLMQLLPNYVLHPHPDVPSKFKHPGYIDNSNGGAWAVGDYIAYAAECQAIVRFVTKVIKQIGVPGTVEDVYIYADPANAAVALEDPPQGLLTALHRFPAYSLVDSPVSAADVGRVFPPDHTTMPDGSVSMGFNAFEACLKFTAPGPGGRTKTRYYPGGMGGQVFEDKPGKDAKQAVLDNAFYALVKTEFGWYPSDSDPSPMAGRRIVEITRTYRAP